MRKRKVIFFLVFLLPFAMRSIKLKSEAFENFESDFLRLFDTEVREIKFYFC